MHVQTRQCLNPSCRFRFPWNENDPPTPLCPRCGGPLEIVAERLLSVEMAPRPVVGQTDRPFVAALLDNVRSTFNVGSIFRCADGAGFAHLYLCGITPTPAHPKVLKTALGAEATTPWSYHRNALELAHELVPQGYRIWVLEEQPEATSLFAPDLVIGEEPLLLVLGNEVAGVDPGLLAIAEQVVAIPMQGAKRSLNVAIAFGIAAYTVRFLVDRTSCYNTD
ncbi:MAG TPA: TrmH family RNA methyltransferase [Caldilineaceae bacterium]|nr:TrmH family RNA methyltransferase [Caldilineaceae bacterium]